MLADAERAAIARLWTRKTDQDARKLPKQERHRNLHPDSAEFVCALAAGLRAKRLVEIGGSSGVSTIALAAAARATGGVVTSIEIEPSRQEESRRTIASLGLSAHVRFATGDAAAVLPTLGEQDFALIDCEKEDYVRFFDLLRLAPGAVVVADNILSHDLTAYVAHVRARPGVESVTLPVGKGLEVTRTAAAPAKAAAPRSVIAPLVAALLLGASFVTASAADDAAPPLPGPVAPPPPPPLPPRTFTGVKLVDPYWALTYKLPGLVETAPPDSPGLLFLGKSGDVAVEIRVEENTRERSADECRLAVKAAWTDAKRDMRDAASTDAPVPTETFVEKNADGAETSHGYGYYVRGLHLFVVHATTRSKSDASAADVARALGALKLGHDRGCSVVAQAIAKSRGKPVDSAQVLVDAGRAYLSARDKGGADNPAMGERVLRRALDVEKAGELPPGTLYDVHEMLGAATLALRKYDDAVRWFKTAADVASKTESPATDAATSTFHLARAYAAAGRKDDAFASLEKAFATASPVDVAGLRDDAVLEPLHADPRWEAFIAARAAAAGMKR